MYVCLEGDICIYVYGHIVHAFRLSSSKSNRCSAPSPPPLNSLVSITLRHETPPPCSSSLPAVFRSEQIRRPRSSDQSRTCEYKEEGCE